MAGHANTVRALLENHADPNLRGPDGDWTALSLAISQSHSPDCVRLLLEHGADPNHELHDPTLLVQAVQATMPLDVKREIMDLLVNHSVPVDVDAGGNSSRGLTPLMYAAASGDREIVEWLLAHQANIALVDASEQNALFHAVIGRHLSVVQVLLERGSPLAEKNKEGVTMLRLAVGEPQILQLLLGAGADPELEDGDKSTLINTAAAQGKVGALRILVSRGVNIHHRDSAGWTPILDACRDDHDEEAVRILMDGGARSTDATPSGHTPLHEAVMQGRPDILRILLEYRTVLDLEAQDDEKDTALATAAFCNEPECLRLLLRAGALVNNASDRGWTPFLYAVNVQLPPETIDLLLAQPSLQIHTATAVEGAAIHLACQSLQIDTVTKLIRRGADINQQVFSPICTPLVALCHPSATSGRTRQEILDLQDRLVRELVHQGANVAAQHGFSIHNPLSAACLGAGVSVINYLLYKGALPQLRDPLGRPAIHFAAANGLENFEAMHQADPGMLMADDKGQKISLHWAAQFGRAQTVDAILNYVSLPAERKRYVNEPDVDGWTPLCWALRPSELDWAPTMVSEPANYPQTVRLLLERGADPTVRCRIGEQDRYTPLQLAYLHDAGDEIIQLLRAALPGGIGASPDPEPDPSQVYSHYPDRGSCDICFSTLYGISYICTICDSFIACRKCYSHLDVYLSDVPVPGPEAHTHELKQWDNGEPEFRDPLVQSQPTDPVDMDEEKPTALPGLDRKENADDTPSQDAADLPSDDTSSEDGIDLNQLLDEDI